VVVGSGEPVTSQLEPMFTDVQPSSNHVCVCARCGVRQGRVAVVWRWWCGRGSRRCRRCAGFGPAGVKSTTGLSNRPGGVYTNPCGEMPVRLRGGNVPTGVAVWQPQGGSHSAPVQHQLSCRRSAWWQNVVGTLSNLFTGNVGKCPVVGGGGGVVATVEPTQATA